MMLWSPFIVEEVFAVNDFIPNKIIIHKVWGETIITYEDVFKYPHKIKEYLLMCPAAGWKHIPGIGKNFVEYWECRHDHSLGKVFEYYKLLEKIFYLIYHSYVHLDQTIISNMFQWKENPHQLKLPNYFGEQPHYDEDNGFGSVLSFNDETDITDNGIAFWKSKEQGIFKRKKDSDHLINVPGNIDDGSSYYNEHPEKYWEIPPGVMVHNFNKLVIFPGEIYHGAYFNKFNFTKYPRITISTFLRERNNNE